MTPRHTGGPTPPSDRRLDLRADPAHRSRVAGRRVLPPDRGSASMWAVGGILAVVTVMTLAVWIGAAAATRHRAASAADLAALAAAGAAAGGQEHACGKARWVTDRMNVELRSCRLRGWDARVEVAARPPGVLAGFGSAEARARAGPVVSGADASSTVVPTR